MQIDAVLELLQPLLDLRVALGARLAGARALLLGELLARLGELLLLVGQLLLEDVALALLRIGARRGRLFREAFAAAPARALRRRRLGGGHHVDLARDQVALLADGVLLVAGVERPAARVDALVDFGDLRERRGGQRRRDRENQRNQSPKRRHGTYSLAQKKKGRL